jgi:hypothetical protein
MSVYIIIWLCYIGVALIAIPIAKALIKGKTEKKEKTPALAKLGSIALGISIGLFVLWGVGLSFFDYLSSTSFNPTGVLFVIGLLSLFGCIVSITLIFKE